MKKIKRADYEGNRTTLREYFNDLDDFTKDEALASKALYWRGFAMWRIAVNGFNDSAESKELDSALRTAMKEFDLAALQKFLNIEVKIGRSTWLNPYKIKQTPKFGGQPPGMSRYICVLPLSVLFTWVEEYFPYSSKKFNFKPDRKHNKHE